MADSIRVLVTRQFPEAGIRLLERKGFCLTLPEKDRLMAEAELKEKIKGHQVLLCTLTEPVSRAVMAAEPGLKLISQVAVGYDNIDIAAATTLGIPVGFTPDVMSEATADIAFGLMIATARKMFFHHRQILDGNWDFFRPCGHLGMELAGKTLGIVGMGRIGMKMAQRCHGAYGMKILYHSRSRNPAAEKAFGAVKLDFEDLLAQSDVISVHTALSPETRGMFDKRAFEQMKPTALFINTARGPIHNEAALRQALERGEIAGAGLDVTDPEPMDRNNPLLTMENSCILPHIGSATKEARDAMSMTAAQNIIDFFNTGMPGHVVNPEAIRS